MKESYVKMTGERMSVLFEVYEVDFDQGCIISVCVEESESVEVVMVSYS